MGIVSKYLALLGLTGERGSVDYSVPNRFDAAFIIGVGVSPGNLRYWSVSNE